MAEASLEQASNPRTVSGVVVSDSMNKTVTVRVERRVRHQAYGKFITRSKKFMAHDEANEFKIGDQVEIGANSTIDRGSGPDTVIGDGCKIDNLVQIGHNVRVGRHCILCFRPCFGSETRLRRP